MSAFSQQDNVLTVYAFLGSATFVALFFLLQSKEFIKNYDALVFIVAIASILFILAVVGRLNISNNRIKSGTVFANLVSWMAVSGFFLILVVLSLLIAEINLVLGIIVVVFIITLVAILEILAHKS